MSKRSAPYVHADGSDCYTQNCSLGNLPRGVLQLVAPLAVPSAAAKASTPTVEDAALRREFGRVLEGLADQSQITEHPYEWYEWYADVRDEIAAAGSTKELLSVLNRSLPRMEDEIDQLPTLCDAVTSPHATRGMVRKIVEAYGHPAVFEDALTNPNLVAADLDRLYESMESSRYWVFRERKANMYAKLAAHSLADGELLQKLATHRSLIIDDAIAQNPNVMPDTLRGFLWENPLGSPAYARAVAVHGEPKGTPPLGTPTRARRRY